MMGSPNPMPPRLPGPVLRAAGERPLPARSPRSGGSGYRSAGESARPYERLMTFTPENPKSVNPDWPFRGIDHVLIRCGDCGGPSLPIRSCRRTFDQGSTSASDHYGLVVEFGPPPCPSMAP
jgi:endonuclease/exonuclease/phosphatase family metal-dependent hydrolase